MWGTVGVRRAPGSGIWARGACACVLRAATICSASACRRTGTLGKSEAIAWPLASSVLCGPISPRSIAAVLSTSPHVASYALSRCSLVTSQRNMTAQLCRWAANSQESVVPTAATRESCAKACMYGASHAGAEARVAAAAFSACAAPEAVARAADDEEASPSTTVDGGGNDGGSDGGDEGGGEGGGTSLAVKKGPLAPSLRKSTCEKCLVPYFSTRIALRMTAARGHRSVEEASTRSTCTLPRWVGNSDVRDGTVTLMLV